MEHVSTYEYAGLTVLLTLALFSCGYLRLDYLTQRRRWAWRAQMLGWSAIVVRFWWGLFTDQTISYAGAIGLLPLACGAVLEAMRK